MEQKFGHLSIHLVFSFSQTIHKMLDPLHGEKFQIAMDSLFGGIPSLQVVIEQNMDAIFSCRADRQKSFESSFA